MTKQISAAELSDRAQSDQGKPRGEVSRLSDSHRAQKHRWRSRAGDQPPVCTLGNKENGTNYWATGITDRQNWCNQEQAALGTIFHLLRAHTRTVFARGWAAQPWWTLLGAPFQLFPACSPTPVWGGWAGLAAWSACSQHPVGPPMPWPMPAAACCCHGAQWPQGLAWRAILSQDRQRGPSQQHPHSSCSRGSYRDIFCGKLDHCRPERDELQVVFRKLEELLAFPHGWTAPSWSLSSRLGPGTVTVVWLQGHLRLPKAAALVLASPSTHSFRMGILIVGVWETPPGWSHKPLEQVYFLFWEQHTVCEATPLHGFL